MGVVWLDCSAIVVVGCARGSVGGLNLIPWLATKSHGHVEGSKSVAPLFDAVRVIFDAITEILDAVREIIDAVTEIKADGEARGQMVRHAGKLIQPTCELSLKMGSSIARARPPTMTPMPATMIGSSSDVADLIAMLTSES